MRQEFALHPARKLPTHCDLSGSGDLLDPKRPEHPNNCIYFGFTAGGFDGQGFWTDVNDFGSKNVGYLHYF